MYSHAHFFNTYPLQRGSKLYISLLGKLRIPKKDQTQEEVAQPSHESRPESKPTGNYNTFILISISHKRS